MTTSLRHTFGLGLLLLAATAHAATVDVALYAKLGATTMPDTTVRPVLGYVGGPTDPVTAPGGPVITVNQGDVVRISLFNALAEPTALLVQGQGMIPDTVGVAAGADNSASPYTFTATSPGTYLYEAGPVPNAQHQVAMGLHGALVVRPATPGQAYDTTITAYDDEAVLVLSELDPELNASPTTFDMRNFAPKYFLINGKAYPSTSPIATAAGRKVLLRYVNAGVQQHSMTLLGIRQVVIAVDGSPLTNPGNRVAETVAPGQTLDVIATVPASATGQFALADGSLMLFNNRAPGFGGMLTFLATGGTPPAAGPVVTALTLTGNALAATIAASAPLTVAAAEYWVDAGAHSAMTGGPAAWVATVPTQPSGNHLVYVRGQDNAGTWGAPSSTPLAIDTAGPATTGIVLTPSSSNGSTDVALSATGDDRATGNANVAAAEYSIDGGASTAMTVTPSNVPGPGAPVASLTATLPAATVNALAEGLRLVSVRSQDALGNWGAPSTGNLVVDKTGPTTSAVVVPPNNGTTGVNSYTAAVRVTATVTDSASAIATAEGFIDAMGAPGTGFPFVPTDGVIGGRSWNASADIPLSTVNGLASGSHTVYVRGKDAAGNWGAPFPASPGNWIIDRAAPTFTGIAVAPSPTLGATSVTLTVNGAADTGGAGVAGGEYWIGTTVPATGTGTAFTGLTPSIPVGTLATGTYTMGARIRDAAGNWSVGTQTAQFQVLPDVIFVNGFEPPPNNGPWGWTSRSTGTTSRLNATAAAALAGTRGLQAQGNNTNYVQYNFGTATNPASSTFDARFYFRPNGNSSAGKDIFSAATSNTFGTTLFRVRYQLNGTTPQVQIQMGTGNANTAWTNILGATSNNVIEVVKSGTTLQLYVNGALAQTLTATTGSVGAFRLGSVTSGGNATLMYFDALSSKRTTASLIGP